MANAVLLLLLEGPLQSWGTRSRWDVRDTGLEPTKSGIIGLIGCAMGLSRNDSELERLDRELLFGVRVDRPGVVSTDYQTVTGYHRTAAGGFKHSSGTAKKIEKAMEHGESTIVSPRDYLHDAAFLVALTVKSEYKASNPDLLVRLEENLSDPKWPLYLGRKACVPSRPILERLTNDYPDLESALRNEPWVSLCADESHTTFIINEKAPNLIAWIECPDGEFERQDAIRLNQLRLYDFRQCKRIEVNTQSLQRRIA